jgi:hypothetical protein
MSEILQVGKQIFKKGRRKYNSIETTQLIVLISKENANKDLTCAYLTLPLSQYYRLIKNSMKKKIYFHE